MSDDAYLAALDLAAYGWNVFPVYRWDSKSKVCGCGRPGCSRPGKHPSTKNGLSDATRDEDKLKSWFKSTPSNLAIRTGEGLMVLDVDVDKGGMESLRGLEEEYGPMPETRTCLTGGGGMHLYFRVKESVSNSVEKLGKGLDVRGDGGYVIVPPSMHASGRPYAWDIGQTERVADCPPWLLKLARKPRPEDVEGIPQPDAVLEGARNDYLASFAGAMRRRGATEKVILVALLEQNKEVCKPPLPEDEVRRIAKSIASKPAAEDPQSWTSQLKLNSKGVVYHTVGNAAVYLMFHPAMQGKLKYNEFSEKVVWAERPPEGLLRPEVGEFQEEHLVYVQHWMSKTVGVNFGIEPIYHAVRAVAKRNGFHPLRDWLDSLEWDGVKRIGRWLYSYCGVANSNAIAADMGRWFLLSAVARVYSPGCQVDHVLVLEGDQGVGKSSIVRVLGGEYYLGKMPKLSNQYAAMYLNGYWIAEIPELDAMKGVERSQYKEFITQGFDVYKEPYAKLPVKRLRQCAFIGTTNESAYLDDAENRRFWPVRVGTIKLDALTNDRAQLWAEAVHSYKSGSKWHPETEDKKESLRAEQEDRATEDAWEDTVRDYLIKCEVKMEPVSMEKVLRALGFDLVRVERRHQMRAGDVMRRLGWEARRGMVNGVRQRVWLPTPRWNIRKEL